MPTNYEENIKALDAEIARREKINSQDAEEIKTLESIRLGRQQLIELQRKSEEYQQRRLKDLELEKVLLQANAKFLDSKQENLDSFVRLQQIEIEQRDINLQKQKEDLKLTLQKENSTKEEKEAALEAYLIKEKELLNLQEQLEISAKLGQQTKDIISSTMGISARWKETFFGKLLDKDGDSVKNMKAISASIKDTFTVQNMAGSTLMKIQEATAVAFYKYDQAASSIARLAGANEQLLGVLQATSRGSTAYGISFQEAGKAIESLYSELNTFSNLNSVAQQQLTISTAKLDRLGISGQQSAKQIGTLTQIMGMSEVQAGKTSEKLAGFALAIGKTPQQVSQDFAAASNQLSAYGGNMLNVFKDLEVQSKATGVAVGDLISITEKFQTFEGAAQAAGKLNAALGGGFINSMELLEASAENPAKAIDLLRTRLDEAGISFNQMSFYEQKMIADAAGFKTIEEASRVLSMSNAEAEAAAKTNAERANQQEILNKAIERAIPIQEKIELLMANFAVTMGPPIEAITGFLSGVLELIDKVPGLSYVLAGVAAGLVLVMLAIKGFAAVNTVVTTFGILETALTGTAAAGPAAAGGLEALGPAAGGAAPGIAALGAAFIELAAGIFLAGAGFGILFAGVGYMIKSVAELFNVLKDTDGVAGKLATLAGAMGALSMIFIQPLVLLGLAGFAVALGGIILALNQLDEAKSKNFSVITESIAQLNVNTTTTPNNIMQQTGTLVKAINEFSLTDASAANLERILKAAIPQNTTPNISNTYSPQIIVKIDGKQIRGVTTEVKDDLGTSVPGSPASP